MKTEKFRLCIYIVILLIFFTILGLPEDQEPVQNRLESPVTVSPAWLTERLNDRDIVILHVSSTRTQYNMGHIPGACFLWPGWLMESTPESSVELPSIEKTTGTLENLGVSNSSRIILCGSGGNAVQVARIFATFEYLGMSGRVSILDGGYENWIASGGQVSRKTTDVKKSDFVPLVKSDVFVSSEFVLKNIGKPDVIIIDARAPQYYSGESGYPRKGHIPGAVNFNTARLIDPQGKFLEENKLRELFTASAVKPGTDLIVYCNVGASASVVYTTARQLGYKVHIYDGSFEEWSAKDDLPLEVSPKPTDQPSEK
jgi:thiosulfate/3-mercaptopyruvate sulfurtransferase